MGRQERQEHDAAWGLNFGDPSRIRVAPEPNKGGGLLKRWFGKQQADIRVVRAGSDRGRAVGDLPFNSDPSALASRYVLVLTGPSIWLQFGQNATRHPLRPGSR